MRATMNPATDRAQDRGHRGAEHGRLGMRDGGHAPDHDREREPGARAHLVDHPPRDQEPDRVGELEREDDVGVVDLAPAELLLQRRLEDADHLAVDVVDRRREEQQRADHPAVVPRFRADTRGCTHVRGKRSIRHRVGFQLPAASFQLF
jgi:hypothetical protein